MKIRSSTTPERTSLTNYYNYVIDKSLEKSYDGLEVLKDINTEVKERDMVSLIGPSGSGKSTLIKFINFIEIYDKGKIVFNGDIVGYIEKNGRKIMAPDKIIICAHKWEWYSKVLIYSLI